MSGDTRSQKVALVTGASRGLGRGIAIGLVEAGFRVFGLGRSIDQADLPESVQRICCDHLLDEETTRAFETVDVKAGRLDLLVNCAWGGYEGMVERGAFTWFAPFWDQPLTAGRAWSTSAFGARSFVPLMPRA